MIRPATPADVPEIHAMVCELAAFEKLSHAVVSTPGDLQTALFGDPVRIEALVVEKAGDLIAFALFYPTFSTFTGKPGLWLEDVFVRPDHRGNGVGRALLDTFLETARSRGCSRAEWSVLDWNTHAIDLYEHLGATVMPDWRIARREF